MVALAQTPKTALQSRLQDYIPLDVEELILSCPGCKALETALFDHTTMLKNRRFTQVGGNIYHHCGSTEPCKVFRNG